MNIKCKCGHIHMISLPKIEANLDVAIYTDGVVEGGSVPRDIKVFRCSSCNNYYYLATLERVEEQASSIIVDPTANEYHQLIELEDFNSLGIRVKAWQRVNDRYRDLDSLEDIGVKIELLKVKIAAIPDIAHFNQYIDIMMDKYKQYKDESILDKVEQLREKREKVLERVEERSYLLELEAKQESMRSSGEIEIAYSSDEIKNMRYLLENLDNTDTSLLIKGEIHRNLGEFSKAIDLISQIKEKHYDNIKGLILHLATSKLKKTAPLRD